MRAEHKHLPAPQGRLFVVTLQMLGDLRAGVLRQTGSGFLGGVLHGAVRSRWFDLAGLDSGLSWRILVPPADAAAGLGSGRQHRSAHQFQFGVLMHGGHPALWNEAQEALELLTDLGVGAWRVPLLSARCRHRALPMGGVLPFDWGSLGLGTAPPLLATVALHWCTPLHLASRSKIQAGHGGAPPSLLAVLRSLRRRACLLEPQWASAFGLASDAWVADEEALRQAPSGGHGAACNRLRVVVWRYGSRTKSAPFLRQGLMGSQLFRAPVTAPVLGLLSLGVWLGVGEGASFGCGQYRLRLRWPGGERLPALLPQPWAGRNGSIHLLGQNS